MLRHISVRVPKKACLASNCTGRSHRNYGTKPLATQLSNAPRNIVFVLSSVGLSLGLYLHVQQTVRNDASSIVDEKKQAPSNIAPALASNLASEDDGLRTVAWGSNIHNLSSPNDGDAGSNKAGRTLSWLNDVALKDVAIHDQYGVCVDARGDVYQWTRNSLPRLILGGKNIQTLQATSTRILALGNTGRIYSMSPSSEDELSAAQTKASTGFSLFPWNWFSTVGGIESFAEISPEGKLERAEKFVSISAGSDHMLALTSTGRTFVYPITPNANIYGQLASKRFVIPKSATSSGEDDIDLVPKAIEDPYAKSRPFVRKTRDDSSGSIVASSSKMSQLSDVKDQGPFCNKLFEVQSLKGITVAQAVAGARSSFVRTKEEGRVLAWGANEYGQLGLGSSVIVDTVTVPTEVVLSRYTQMGTRSQCINIITGGDLTFFMVERVDGTSIPAVDVLACGMGQWGGLGNGIFTTAQGTPLRVKSVSGLVEFSEKHGNLQAITPHSMSVSSSGHVLLTLETLLRSGSNSSEHGRDLFVWGQNKEYQLGTGKKTSLAVPTSIDTPEGGRVMLRKRKAGVKDLQGKIWKKDVEVEQVAVAGYASSMVYWRLC